MAEQVAVLRRVLHQLEQLEQLQEQRVWALACRLRPHLTPDDLRSPQDFAELRDPDWHYADGQLAGIRSCVAALRAMQAQTEAPPDAANRS